MNFKAKQLVNRATNYLGPVGILLIAALLAWNLSAPVAGLFQDVVDPVTVKNLIDVAGSVCWWLGWIVLVVGIIHIAIDFYQMTRKSNAQLVTEKEEELPADRRYTGRDAAQKIKQLEEDKGELELVLTDLITWATAVAKASNAFLNKADAYLTHYDKLTAAIEAIRARDKSVLNELIGEIGLDNEIVATILSRPNILDTEAERVLTILQRELGTIKAIVKNLEQQSVEYLEEVMMALAKINKLVYEIDVLTAPAPLLQLQANLGQTEMKLRRIQVSVPETKPRQTWFIRQIPNSMLPKTLRSEHTTLLEGKGVPALPNRPQILDLEGFDIKLEGTKAEQVGKRNI